LLKDAASLKFRDIIAETVHEFQRKGNFVRIFPAKNSKLYDKFFTGQKPLNKIIYKVLFTSELMPYSKSKAIERNPSTLLDGHKK